MSMGDEPAKIARRVLDRNGVSADDLPIPLDAIASRYAAIDVVSTPFDFDGITLKSKGREPTILLNRHKPSLRRRFTLAHELGHVLLPWHVGIILDKDEEQFDFPVNTEYRALESEANQFAAELLLPTKTLSEWVQREMARNGIQSVADTITEISQKAQTSRLTTTLRVFEYLPPNFLFFVTDKSGVVKYKGRSPETYIRHVDTESFDIRNLFDDDAGKESIQTSMFEYVYYDLRQTKAVEWPNSTDWRSVLLEILEGQASFDAAERDDWYKSVNSRIGAFYGTYIKTTKCSFAEVFTGLVRRLSTYTDLEWLRDHSRYDEFVRRKSAELWERMHSP